MNLSSKLKKIGIIFNIILIMSFFTIGVINATTEASKRSEAEKAGNKASELYQKVGEAETKIRAIQDDINDKQAEINTTKENIEKTKADIEKQNDLLNDRLSVMYKTGSVGLIEVILNSKDVNELITNISMVQRILTNDKKVLKNLKKKNKDLETLEADLSKQEGELKKSQSDVQSIRDQYKANADEYKRQQQELIDEANRIAAETAKAQAEAERKLAEQKNSSNNSSNNSSATSAYLWPLSVNGVITSGYGYRSDPFLGTRSYHNGIDIAAPMGTPIRSVADGYVTLSSWYGGYGNCVIISIGGGKSTLYGHMNSRACSTGQYVKKGQVVGYIGTTGRSTGPHLHFTLFQNGVDINPYTLY